jgi:hypothetical protein
MITYIDKLSNIVLALHRTERAVTVIGNVRGTRKHYEISYTTFQKDFKATGDSPKHLADVWLKSPLPISAKAKGVLQMSDDTSTELEVKATKKKGKVKEAKPPKEKKASNRGIIRSFLEGKDTFTIADIVGLVGGSNGNASTTITLLVKPEKCGKEGPIPFQYDKVSKVYHRVV